MTTKKETSLRGMRGPMLRSVSRSFYLSIRLLPEKLRDPIALAYLLARATDTVADTAEIDPEVRKHALAKLAAMIQQKGPVQSLQDFAALQKDRAERALLEAVPECLRWLEGMESGDKTDIHDVLARINEGQTLDVQRFSDPAQVTALQSARELDHYTYLVAGAAGEFWTKVCFRHLPDFSQESRTRMISLGVEYGKGLQLVNVLRDIGADLRAGRCYLPAEELRSFGVTPQALRREPSRAQPGVKAWQERAQRGIAAGVEYSCAIRPWRVRLATALPALIGAHTLALLDEAGATLFVKKVKVSRAEVRRIIFNATRTLASPGSLRRTFQTLSS